MKINAPNFADFRQRMLNMGAVVEPRQVADEPHAPNRSPSDKFDQPIISFSVGCDHHCPAGEFAVAESQEQARAAVNMRLAVGAEWKRASAKARQTNTNRGLIANFPPPSETAHAQSRHVRGEADAQQVYVMQHSVFVTQAKNVAFSRASGNQRLHRVLDALIAEIAQKRVSRAEWKEAEGRLVRSVGERKQSVHNFVGSSVSADGNELAIARAPDFPHGQKPRFRVLQLQVRLRASEQAQARAACGCGLRRPRDW